MTILLERLASEVNNPCVSIALNTHRTHPDNLIDVQVLKKLLKEAEERVINEFGKRPVKDLLKKIEELSNEIDSTYFLDSLHIFLSSTTKEIIKSTWPVDENTVQVSDRFSIKPLIKLLNRTENYLILLLSQSGVRLWQAQNGNIVEEIKNEDFPFSKNLYYSTNNDKLSDAKQVDAMVNEFLNIVDKAMAKVHNETSMRCVVFCAEDNYSRFIRVADQPAIYYGHLPVDYNKLDDFHLANEAWKMVNGLQEASRLIDVNEMKQAFGQGYALTDLREIYAAVKEGRGELLIAQDDFRQAVIKTGALTFDYISDNTLPDAIDDLSSEIAWDVISKKGRVMFTTKETPFPFGGIALKVRY